MDTPRGLSDHEADQALRDLFQQVGMNAAPEGMEARVMHRIAVLERHGSPVEKPLLPRWVWWLGAVGMGMIALLTPGSSTTNTPIRIPSLELDRIYASPWLIMGLITATALLALDAWLGSRRPVAAMR